MKHEMTQRLCASVPFGLRQQGDWEKYVDLYVKQAYRSLYAELYAVKGDWFEWMEEVRQDMLTFLREELR